MDLLKTFIKNVPAIEKKIGYSFKNSDLLLQAFVHRSFIHEVRSEGLHHNERLEFLGDSILGLLVAEYLFHRLPDCPEGNLSKLRSLLVDASSCASYLEKLELVPYILLGRGERIHVERPKNSIISDVFEAVIGALYLDGDLGVVKAFLSRFFIEDFEAIVKNPPRNYKAELQDFAQRTQRVQPTYEVVEAKGPDHAKTFLVQVLLGQQVLGEGKGPSKKEAEQLAAKVAIEKIEGSD